jgi:type III secretion protein T
VSGELTATLQSVVIAFLLSMPRLVALFGLIPFLGRTSLPGLVQVGVVMSLLLVLQPMVLASLPAEPLGTWRVLGLGLKESLIGLLIGFTFVIVFHAVQAAGFFIDNQRGSTMASSVDPLLGGQTSTIGLLLTQAFVVYFFVSGGFLTMLGVIYASYEVMPILSFVPRLPPDGALFIMQQLDRLVRIAFVLAAPVFAAMFLAEIGVALVSRFAPQLNVFFLAMPIKSGVAFLVLVLYIRTFMHQLGLESATFGDLFRQLRGVMQ